MQIDRLFGIVYTLLYKKMVTALELSKTFEVSARTIYRDIETLSAAGIPVYAIPGKGGGITLLDNFVLEKTTLSSEEQEYIIAALKNLAPSEYMDSNRIIQKLNGMFQKKERDWLEVDYSRWGFAGNDKEKFLIIKNAIWNERTLTFIYYSAQGEKSIRFIHPCKLIFKSKSWYLQGYCKERQGYRTFKINRMTDVLESDEEIEFFTAKLPPVETADALYPLNEEVVLEFPKKLAYRVYDEFSPEEINFEEDSIIVRTHLAQDEWLLNLILSFGRSIKVISPQTLQQSIAAEARAIAGIYGSQIKINTND